MTPDLSTIYLGLALRTPLVASSSPLTGDLDGLRALEAAGASAVVLPSLFEEQLTHDAMQLHAAIERGAHGHGEADGYLPEMRDYNAGPSGYLRHLESAKATLRIPVIASLNGCTPGGWVRYARILEEAGADAVELNIYRVVADCETSGRLVEEEVVEVVSRVRDELTIPLAVKLGPFYSSLGHLAVRLAAAGAQGLVLFNRFYQPDVDVETLEVEPRLVLSTSEELRLPLRWLAILHGRVPKLALAATTGIHTGVDAAKALLAGADVTMLASAVLRHGPGHIGDVEAELVTWMRSHEYDSVEQLRGSLSQRGADDPSAFERANYMRTLRSYASPLR